MSDPRLPQEEGEDDLGEIEENPDQVDDGSGETEEVETTADAGTQEGDSTGQDQGQTRNVGRRERAGDTIQRLRARAQTAEDRLAEFERRFAVLEQQPRTPPVDPLAQQRQLEAERERVAQMMPHEAAEYWANKTRQETSQQMLTLQLQMLDGRDEANFNALRASNPEAARLASAVEADVRQLRAAGIYQFGRLDAFYRRLGQEWMEKATRAAPRQRAAAQQRVAGQRTQPGNGRGDVVRTGGNRADADEALLRGATIGEGWR